MSNQPPPTGYDSWIDWCMDHHAKFNGENRDAARKELAGLRANAEAWRLFSEEHRTFNWISAWLNDQLAAIEKEYAGE